MGATFNGNPGTTIFCCCSPINAIDETNITTCDNGLSSPARPIPKFNLRIIGRDMDAEICTMKLTNLAYITRKSEMANIK